MENGDIERFWTSKEVCNTFRITGSTLRKWCLQLEALGYVFSRNEIGQRMFKAQDREILTQMKWEIDAGFTIENAAKSVISRVGRASGTVTVPAPRPISLPEELNQQILNELRRIVREEIAASKNDIQNIRIPKLEERLFILGAEIKKINSLEKKIDTLITETRAERHRRIPWWKRLFGRKN